MNIITQPRNSSVVYVRSPIIYKFGGLNTGETYKYVIELRVYKTGIVATPYDSTSIERKYDLLDGTPTITVDVSNLMYNWLRDNINYEQENIIRFSVRIHEYNNGVLTGTISASYPYATLGYVQYVEATTTTTTTLPTCGYIAGNDIFYDADDPCVVGVQVGAPLFSDTGIFSTCTILTLWDCDQLATAGYYRQAGYWRYWNGFTFTGDGGYCYPESGTTTTTTTTTSLGDYLYLAQEHAGDIQSYFTYSATTTQEITLNGDLNYISVLMVKVGSPLLDMKIDIYDGTLSDNTYLSGMTLLGSSTNTISATTVNNLRKVYYFYFSGLTLTNTYTAVINQFNISSEDSSNYLLFCNGISTSGGTAKYGYDGNWIDIGTNRKWTSEVCNTPPVPYSINLNFDFAYCPEELYATRIYVNQMTNWDNHGWIWSVNSGVSITNYDGVYGLGSLTLYANAFSVSSHLSALTSGSNYVKFYVTIGSITYYSNEAYIVCP